MVAVTTAVAGAGVLAPHIGLRAASIPGVAALHEVRTLLTCDAMAIDAIRSGPMTTAERDAAACSAPARALAGR